MKFQIKSRRVFFKSKNCAIFFYSSPDLLLLVLDLFEPEELLPLQFVQLGDDVGEGVLDAGDDHVLDRVHAAVGDLVGDFFKKMNKMSFRNKKKNESSLPSFRNCSAVEKQEFAALARVWTL